MPVTVKLSLNLLAGASAKVRAQADAIVAQTADAVISGGQRGVAYDSGETFDHIRIDEAQTRQGHRVVISDRPSTDAEGFSVPMLLEHGSSTRAARPYMTPAAEAERSGFTSRMEKLIPESL